MAYIFFRQSETERETIARPDLEAAEGFLNIVSRSRLARKAIVQGLLKIPLMYESQLTEAGIVEGRLEKYLAGELLDRLRQGHVKVWGTPRDSHAEKEIEKEEWAKLELDFNERDLHSIPPHICAITQGMRGGRLEYVAVRFSKRNLYREFPLTCWPRRIDYVPLKK